MVTENELGRLGRVSFSAPIEEVVKEPPAAPEAQQSGDEGVSRKRIPFGAVQQKLATAQRPGYYRYWFNEKPGRIQAALDAGYTHVRDANGAVVQRIVGTKEQGGGLNAYLMELPLHYHEEDLDAKDAPRRRFDADIRRGHGSGNAPGVDGKYVPMNPDNTPRIKIKHNQSPRG